MVPDPLAQAQARATELQVVLANASPTLDWWISYGRAWHDLAMAVIQLRPPPEFEPLINHAMRQPRETP